MTPITQRLILLLAIAITACSKAPERPGPTGTDGAGLKTYSVRGIVRGINFAERTASIEHEEIPKYMPSMTMPFNYRDPKEVEALKAGDAISFEFTVSENDSWISGVKKIDPAEVKLPKPQADAPGANVPSGRRSGAGIRLVDLRGGEIVEHLRV